MIEVETFETALERRLRARAAIASRPFDAATIAAAAVGARSVPRSMRWFPVRRVRPRWVALLAILALVAAALAAAGIKAPPTTPRPLLAIGAADGFSFAEADGSGPRLLRQEGPYFQPRWSSDGTFVAVSLLHPEDANHLDILRPDGSIAAQAANVFGYGWSPTGHLIAALSSPGRSLKVIDVDSPDLGPGVELPPGPVGLPMIDSFAWAPDGRSLLVAARRAADGAPASLWLVHRDGSPSTQFSAEESAALPAWSPDGSRVAAIVSHCGPAGCSTDIRIYDGASGGRRSEVQNVVAPGGPLWSTDGSVVVFDAAVGTQRDVFRYDLLANTVTRVTTGPAIDRLVGWDPDGRSIVISRQAADGAPLEFWRVTMDGSDRETRLVAVAYGVALQPMP